MKDNATSTVQHVKNEMIFQVPWLSGIVISILCFLVQIIIFIRIRGSRKTDEKTLAHITFTRILVTCCEYYILYIQKRPRWLVDCIFGLYFTSDFALVCWMLIFTKHLYDKIVIVFNTSKPNFIIITVIVWIVSLPFGVVAVLLLKYDKSTVYFKAFCDLIYIVIKFIIQTFNSLSYLIIFYVAFKRRKDNSRHARCMIKAAFVAFLLISTTCIQILVTDIIAVLNRVERNDTLVKLFCVMNSFHVVPVMCIFIIILNGQMRQSKTKTFTVRMTELDHY